MNKRIGVGVGAAVAAAVAAALLPLPAQASTSEAARGPTFKACNASHHSGFLVFPARGGWSTGPGGIHPGHCWKSRNGGTGSEKVNAYLMIHGHSKKVDTFRLHHGKNALYRFKTH
ncbi:hypothetical protein [Streptomyces sp. NPDC054786]